MTEEAQPRLTDFGSGAEQRPAEEAAHIAGNGGRSTTDIVDPRTETLPESQGTVELAVMQVDYTITGRGDDERPIVHVFGRTSDRDLEHVQVVGFRPYFYAPTSTVSEDRLRGYDAITGWEETDADGDSYESIRGEKLTKIFGRTPRDVGQIRDEFDHYEADILFPNRLLIDKDVRSGLRVPERRAEDESLIVPHDELEATDVDADPRVFTLDIEVEDRHGFPEEGEEPIICLTGHDSYRDEYVLWVFEAPTGDGEIPTSIDDYEPIESELEHEIRSFETEEAMLADLLAYVEETDPDILTGWNFDDFDAPYLLDRLERLAGTHHDYDLAIDRLSRVNEVWRSGWGGPDIKGRVVFDLLYAYQRTVFSELDSYRLDAVGEAELGVGKERYAGKIGDLWEDDPTTLLAYNLRDVELCVELDRQQEIVTFWDEVRSFVGCKLEDAPTPGDAVDMYVLHEAHGRFALPSKGQQEAGEEYEGGAVFDPITGIKENVTVLDLKSLYPMCMVTVNASPETKVDPEAYDGETYTAPSGTHFRKEPDGVMREMISELLAEREEKKGRRNEYDPGTPEYEQYNRQQGAVKVIMNCFTPDTDVLTPDGVRGITDLEVGDEVYSLDPETMQLELKPVVETHAYPEYDGELVDIQTDKIDFRVTPNHRMLVRKNDKNGVVEDEYGFVEAGELYDYCNYELPHDWDGPDGEGLETVDLTEYVDGEYEVWVRPSVHGRTFTAELGWTPRRVPKADVGEVGYVFTAEEFEANRAYLERVCEYSFIHAEPGRKWIPRTYDGDAFLDLLAWFITEGNVYTSTEKQFGDNFRGASTTVKVAQDELAVADGGVNHHATIGELLDEMGFDYYVDGRAYQFTSKLFGNVLTELCGGNSFEKRVPEFVFSLSQRQKRRFLETLIDGDGDRQQGSWRYTTSSEQLRDDVLRLCAHLGLTASYSRDSGSWRIYVSENSKNTLRMHRSGSRSTADDGVYCVTVEDNHTLLAGRNGTFQFVGQSLYGVSGWERFRLYDKEAASAITATGREVIEFTETAANEIDYEVAYGDSVTGDRPIVVRNPDGMVRILPMETLFERATATSQSEILITADGGAVATAASGKSRRQLDGWEALSVSATGEPEWKPITQVIRHKSDKPVVKLQHKFGESITTRDHSYVVDDGGEHVQVSPEDVDEPLRVPGVPAIETLDRIDVYEVLDGYTRTYEDGRSVGSDNAETKIKRVQADDEWVWFGHEHHGELDSTVKVQRYVEFDSEAGSALVRLLAAYLPEGSASTIETTESKFGVSISESNREWLEQLQDDYHRLFENTKASIIESDTAPSRTVKYETAAGNRSITYDDRTLKLQMMNELSAVFFREFAGQTSREKRVPTFVYHLPERLQELFLDIVVEGDGSRVFPRYADEYAERHFDFETTSREFAAGLSILLTQRDQKHSLKYRDAKDTYTIRTCDYYRSGRDPVLTEVNHDGYVYDISVEDNENFVDAVGGLVLHNTDSVMLELGPEVEKDDALEQSFEIEEYINGRYDDFAVEELNAEVHRFQIEFEKLYRRFFQAGTKKRYAGHITWKEGKDVDTIDIVGFEYQRSDIASITKEVQHRVIEMLVKEGDVEGVKEYVNGVIEEVRAGEVSLDEIAIPGGIGKRLDNYDTDTAQVRGAKYANLLMGTNFQRGSKPKRLYLKRVDPAFFRQVEAERGLDARTDLLYGAFKRDPDVICFEYEDQIPAEFEVDYDVMLDKTLKGPIERILEALDISWEEVKSGQQQTGLDNFM